VFLGVTKCGLCKASENIQPLCWLNIIPLSSVTGRILAVGMRMLFNVYNVGRYYVFSGVMRVSYDLFAEKGVCLCSDSS